MTLPKIDLDDQTFDQLAADALEMIPKYFPEWTDHNQSDPGITLLELFAFIFENAIYQLNRVPGSSLERFAELVGVTLDGTPQEKLIQAINLLKDSKRAITVAEFEKLAMKAAPEIIARTKVLVKKGDKLSIYPNDQYIIVIIVPKPNDPSDFAPEPSNELRQKVFEFLRECCPITSRIQVAKLNYYGEIQIAVTVVRSADSYFDNQRIRQNVKDEIRKFLSPLEGGEDGKGWQFGRAIFRSELCQIIEDVAGVDHIYRLLLNGDAEIDKIPLVSDISLVKLPEEQLDIKVVNV